MTEKIISLPELAEKRLVFRSRQHAGQVLAQMLKQETWPDAIVLAIPAGGVPVGQAVAQKLEAAFDVAVVSKITLPWNTEAGYGAIAFDGSMRLNEMLLARLNLTNQQMKEGIAETKEKVRRRSRTLRGQLPFPDLSNRSAIIVDDGLASGFTMFCAIDAVKSAGARQVVVAVPTAHRQAAEAAAEMVDRLYCANLRSGRSFAVAEAYELWTDVSEQELMDLMHDGPNTPVSAF
ncbi:MAG: phosphoribosyltransferase family protein [Desulfosalsimonas sp.]|uniref:phosphoribosyltransferase n=1 Tax=Desulfosalsimonas sp. TaxID=3073848 RepID=UPI0039710D69